MCACILYVLHSCINNRALFLISFLVPAQSLLLQNDPVQCTHPEEVYTRKECLHPTQVEDDNEQNTIFEYKLADSLRTQADGQMFYGGTTSSHNSEQLCHENRQLQMDLVAKNNQIHILQQEIDNLKQIHKHYLTQIEKLSAESQGKSTPVAERYLMRKWPHGIAFVVNNEDFSFARCAGILLPDRKGSVVDENNLRITWEYLGYKVQVLKNLKASEITKEMMQIALQSHENYDSFVCCILSHGKLDYVYGTDGELVKLNEIVKLFQGNFCPSLVSKPKLFFVQACRGKDKDKGIQRDNGPEKVNSSLPIEADFLLSYSSPPEYASLRSTKCGSWYICKLCEVLVDYSTQQDLLSMLTMVTNKVSDCCSDEGYKQCPDPNSRLRKQVWFFGNNN